MQTTVVPLAEALDARLAALWRLLSRGAGSEQLSRTSVSVLATLRDSGPRRVTQLAASEGVAQPTMTTLVGRLERLGLVERGPDPDDARAVRVSITGDGAARVRRFREARAAALGERLAALRDDERAALSAALPALDSLISGGPSS
jgi:DNA-binding MarR family transcriptional regulator